MISKTILMTLIIAMTFLIGFSAQGAFAGVPAIYDEPVDGQVLGFINSIIPFADDFVINTDTTITDFHVLLIEEPGAFDGNLLYAIHEDDNGLPGIPILDGSGVAQDGVTGVPFDCGVDLPCFDFWADLETPVELLPGTYWIAFSGASFDWGVALDDVFLNSESACSLAPGFWQTSSQCLGIQLGLSFSITGNPIVETIEVDIDLKPQSCPNPVNVLSKGLVPVAILGTAEFDVNDIVISSLPDRTIKHTIEDVATPFGGPIIDQFSCTEAGPDGFDDLIFKIPSSELNCLPDGVLALLIIDGVLLDGTPFEGSDVAKVINKKACPVT